MTRWWESDRLGRVALAAAASLAVVAAVRLAGFASISKFFVDECWHALVARATAEAGTLVTTTTALMRDPYQLDYPPLFHVLGALGYAAAGPSAFTYFNVVVATVLLALVLLMPGKLLDSTQRAGVVLVLLATPLFLMYSVRFYVELLTTLIFFGSWWWFANAIQTGHHRDAVLAGIATGLLVWTKQTGVLVLGLYALFWAWTLVRGESERRRIAGWVVGTAAVIAAPYFGLTIWRGESPLLFLHPTRHPELWAASMAGVEVPRSVFLHTLRLTYGFLPLAVLAFPLAVLATSKRRGYPYAPLLALLVIIALAFLIDHRIVERHTLFLLPLIAFLGVDALERLVGSRGTFAGVVVLAVVAGVHVFTMPNYRVPFNASKQFSQMAAVIEQRTPPDATIVTVWWVEVRYHTGRRVLWPVPNLDDPPLDLFAEQSSDAWFERLRARGIDYLLVDDRYIAERPGVGFSRSTLANIDVLVRDGRMRPVAGAGSLRLFQVLS